ncbi:MAG: anthranilate phosphoribosyltransferase [Pleopsidium flavum]|nr:MAG: anthranilate phosphoribosyltransferase [Pleopsidium flavum]
MASDNAPHISIAPLLKQFDTRSSHAKPTADEIALALSHIFTNQLSPVQTAALLTLLHATGRDREADVIAKCAERMREAAAQVDKKALKEIVRERGLREGSYRGGLCDIVGTGGDGHSTFNISTTASILASSLLLLSKHGNRASSSTSGSADLLASVSPKPPNIEAINHHNLTHIYERTNYAFLFAPKFHPGMRYVAPIRKELGFRTIFNLLGPLANPVEGVIEARVVGVANGDLGQDFAEALKLSGAKKAMVVCGAEDLDEISCAGKTNCWRLIERPNPQFRGPKDEADEDYTTSDDDAPPRTLVKVENFQLGPADFGLPPHALSEVSPGKLPHENAEILIRLLQNRIPREDPILHFVLMNTAALFVIAGVCDADKSDMGHGDNGEVIKEVGPGGGRWKEGVRRARWAVESGEAWRSFSDFIQISNSFDTQ